MHWKIKRRLAKLYKYEYWPFVVFFLPMVPVWLYYAIKTRSLVYFTAVNPGIYLSGLFGESKREILKKLSTEYLPTTLYLDEGADLESVKLHLMQHGLSYPIIIKPDVGERGNDVEKVMHETQLAQYLVRNSRKKLIIQEFVSYDLEFGVFYYRYPQGGSGISSITGKQFLTVRGDGKKTLSALVQSDLRASMQYERLSGIYKSQMDNIIELDQEVLLEPVGNHCRGTMFLNRTHLVNASLVQVFDKISEGFEGFYFGRFDLKVASLESMYEGKGIKVMELNGVTSEPAHVYDPSYSIGKAYRDIIQNMDICAEIARQNHKKGIPYAKAKDIYIYLRKYFTNNGTNPQSSLEPVLHHALN